MLPTLDALIFCEPTLKTQLTLAVIQAVFWAAAIPTVAALGAVYVKKQPWCQQVCRGLRQLTLRASSAPDVACVRTHPPLTNPPRLPRHSPSPTRHPCWCPGTARSAQPPAYCPTPISQWTKLNRSTFKKAFFVDFKTDEEAFDFACLFLGIIAQHATGGALCAPALFGVGNAAVAVTLANHGALCEVGWELQDVATRAYQVLFGGASGKAKNPLPLLIIIAIHHSMGLAMAIPSARPPARVLEAVTEACPQTPAEQPQQRCAPPAPHSEPDVRFRALLPRDGLPAAVCGSGGSAHAELRL